MNQAGTSSESVRLPASIVSKADLVRLIHELEAADDELTQRAVRAKVGSAAGEPLVFSEVMTAFLVENNLTLDDARTRGDLVRYMQKLKDTVPTIHMTFAVQADRPSLETLAQWLRESVHPQAIIAVGLQPSLVAGVYVRTANKVHDLSVRGLLHQQHEALVGQLEALSGAE